MNTLITICARAGSKGLPNKHLLPFCGKPLIEWTIRDRDYEIWSKQLMDSKFDSIVSSDSYQILAIAEKNTLDTRLRPKELSQDDTPKLDVLRDALRFAEQKNNKKYNNLIDLDATNPCRKMQDIQFCFDILREKQVKSVISVVKAKKSPYFNQLQEGNSHWKVETPIRGHFTRRQDIPEVFDVNSCIYVYDALWLKETSVNEGWDLPWWSDTELYVMPEWTRHDIDNEYDFFDCENNFRKYILKQ